MAKKETSRQSLSFEFFANLRRFYEENKPAIRKHYKDLTKKILDYNDPSKGTAFLRQPQFEALEMYVFLKEFAGNRKVHEIFRDWHDGTNGFERSKFAVTEDKHGQGSFLKELKSQTNNKSETSLRTTINELANRLEQAGSRVVACYNYTGTPYIGNSIMPEVVYAYGLKEAINNKYLKLTDANGYANIKSQDFVRTVIKDFWEKEGGDKRFEGMLPKLGNNFDNNRTIRYFGTCRLSNIFGYIVNGGLSGG